MKYIFISLITAILDQGTKAAAKKKLPVGKKKHVKGNFYLWHTKNTGLAYNKFKESRKIVLSATWAAVGIIFTYLCYLIKREAPAADKVGAALLLGGGVGNLIDRIKDKEVTDFMYIDIQEIKNMPIFNFADVAAATGALITIVRALL